MRADLGKVLELALDHWLKSAFDVLEPLFVSVVLIPPRSLRFLHQNFSSVLRTSGVRDYFTSFTGGGQTQSICGNTGTARRKYEEISRGCSSPLRGHFIRDVGGCSAECPKELYRQKQFDRGAKECDHDTPKTACLVRFHSHRGCQGAF